MINKQKVAMIWGATGQDGSYLSEFLLRKNYKVIAVKRRTSIINTSRIDHLYFDPSFKIVYGDLEDTGRMYELFQEFRPDEIYNLACQSHVKVSFSLSESTVSGIVKGTLSLLNAMKAIIPEARYYQACYDENTQVVTKDGIKKYNEIKDGDLVYSINPETREIELKPVIKKYEYDYDGEMVHFKNRRIDCLVTPNHKMFFENDDGKIVTFRAEDVKKELPYNTSHLSLPTTKKRVIKNNGGFTLRVGHKTKNKICSRNIKNIKYNGKVWCLEVKDNHNFLTIRNGKLIFSGNSSSEMFGSNPQLPLNEESKLQPASPYACAKVFGHNIVQNYREAYGLHASSGILMNHESPRRGETFVTRKITLAAANIKMGLQDILELGNLDAKRDWGHAKDFVEAMYLMLQQEKPGDYVISTGEMHSVRDFLNIVFNEAELDVTRYLKINKRLCRPQEVDALLGDSSKAKKILNWEPRIKFEELARSMYRSDLKLIKSIIKEGAKKWVID